MWSTIHHMFWIQLKLKNRVKEEAIMCAVKKTFFNVTTLNKLCLNTWTSENYFLLIACKQFLYELKLSWNDSKFL